MGGILTSALRRRADLDQMSERSIRILKDTYVWLHSLSVANFGFIRFVYILGKWLQKEDIAETAVHFVLKWGFVVNPVSNNSRMLETSLLHICPWNGVCKVMQERKKMDFYIFSVINQKSMASCRVLNCGYFGTKHKVIGQVEEELWFCLPFLWHFLWI